MLKRMQLRVNEDTASREHDEERDDGWQHEVERLASDQATLEELTRKLAEQMAAAGGSCR
jgi:hypothetical protein